MDTNDILRQALYACADATDDIIPGTGDAYRKFADVKYPVMTKHEMNERGLRFEDLSPDDQEALIDELNGDDRYDDDE